MPRTGLAFTHGRWLGLCKRKLFAPFNAAIRNTFRGLESVAWMWFPSIAVVLWKVLGACWVPGVTAGWQSSSRLHVRGAAGGCLPLLGSGGGRSGAGEAPSGH